MLEFLILLPLIMVSILSMTFEVSVDEFTNVSRGNYFKYDVANDDRRSLEDTVHEFYSRVLEEYENENRGSNQGPKCDVQVIQGMIRRCPCGKPKMRCVPIKHPSRSNDMLYSMPYCVYVERCDGTCPPDRQCKPRETGTVNVPVLFVSRFLYTAKECTTVVIEKHVKCGCFCTTSEEHCTSNQKYNPSTCRCECLNPEQQHECKRLNKLWDIATCTCVCPSDIHQVCSTGAVFDYELCKCVQDDRPPGNRRRRPPV